MKAQVTIPLSEYNKLLAAQEVLKRIEKKEVVAWLTTGYWATAGCSTDLTVYGESEAIDGLIAEVNQHRKNYLDLRQEYEGVRNRLLEHLNKKRWRRI